MLFIINDYLDVALGTDADGLHLGQDDLPIQVARKLLPLDKIVGCSVTTVKQAIAAQSEEADYLGIARLDRQHHYRWLPLVPLPKIMRLRLRLQVLIR